MAKELRYYQNKAIECAAREIFDRGKNPIISLPTGAGKTITCIEFVKRHYNLHNSRVLFMVDRVDLVDQGYDNFVNEWPELCYDYQHGIGKVMNKHNEVSARLIIATPQSVSDAAGTEPRLDEILRYGKIDLLIIDEAHTVVNALYFNLIRRLKEANPNLRILGLTATPVRHDGQALSQVFQTIAYHYPMQTAIKEGYLVPLIAEQVETGLELPDGRATIEERAKILNVDNWIEVLLEAHKTLDPHRRGIYYLPTIEHSEKYASALQNAGINAVHIDYKTSDKLRKDALEGFMEGRYDFLCNNMLLSTGVDLPPVNFIGLAAPTSNKVVTTQRVGRSTRLWEGKENSLIRDYYLQGIELISVGSLFGINFVQKGKKVEDESETEVLLEGVDLRDLVGKTNYVTGNGVIRSKFDLFKKKKEAWFSDEEGDIDTTKARGKWADDDIDLTFAILSPNYAIANRLQEGLQNGLKAKSEKPEDLTIANFYDTLYNAYYIINNYTLWEVTNGHLNPNPLFYGESYDELLDRSIVHIAENTNPAVAAKAKSWRRSPATDKQIAFLRQLGYDGEVVKRGEAAQLINHYKFAPMLRKHIQKLLKECRKYGSLS